MAPNHSCGTSLTRALITGTNSAIWLANLLLSSAWGRPYVKYIWIQQSIHQGTFGIVAETLIQFPAAQQHQPSPSWQLPLLSTMLQFWTIHASWLNSRRSWLLGRTRFSCCLARLAGSVECWRSICVVMVALSILPRVDWKIVKDALGVAFFLCKLFPWQWAGPIQAQIRSQLRWLGQLFSICVYSRGRRDAPMSTGVKTTNLKSFVSMSSEL